jgi:hypothetical protein
VTYSAYLFPCLAYYLHTMNQIKSRFNWPARTTAAPPCPPAAATGSACTERAPGNASQLGLAGQGRQARSAAAPSASRAGSPPPAPAAGPPRQGAGACSGRPAAPACGAGLGGAGRRRAARSACQPPRPPAHQGRRLHRPWRARPHPQR